MGLIGYWAARYGSRLTLPSLVNSPSDDGTLTGTASFTSLNGEVVVHCPASSPVTVPDRDGWDSANLTWIMRVAWHSVAGNPSILSHNEGSGVVAKWAWCRGISGARQEVHYQLGGLTVDGANVWTPTIDQIYSVAVTRNGDNWAFYRDGAPDGTDVLTQAFTPASALLRIGDGGEAFFATDCYFASVRMYDVALPDEAVYGLMREDALLSRISPEGGRVGA